MRGTNGQAQPRRHNHCNRRRQGHAVRAHGVQFRDLAADHLDQLRAKQEQPERDRDILPILEECNDLGNGALICVVADIVADTVTTNEDTTIAFNVLTGTNGAEADNFEASGPAGATVTAFTAPTHGTLTQTAAQALAGLFTYVPDANYNSSISGDDTFTYTVSTDDGNGGTVTETTTVTIAITAANDGPVAVDDTYSVAEDGANLVGNLITDTTGGAPDSDVDNDPLAITSFVIAGEGGPFTLGVAYPIAGVGDVTINMDGSFTFDPAPDFNTDAAVGAGTIPTITYTLSDGTATDTATLTCVVSRGQTPSASLKCYTVRRCKCRSILASGWGGS